MEADPWQVVVQIGAQLLSALAETRDAATPAHPWIESDPATGMRSIKLPLPSPQTAKRLADALSALADALRV
jgi:hypothetical protein